MSGRCAAHERCVSCMWSPDEWRESGMWGAQARHVSGAWSERIAQYLQFTRCNIVKVQVEP